MSELQSDYPEAYQQGWDAALERLSGDAMPYDKDMERELCLAWLEGHGDALSLLTDH